MEAPRLGGPAAEISATLAEELFDRLLAPVQRIGALDAPIPMAPALETALLPGQKDITRAVRAALAHTSTREAAHV
jgi:pyruvate dehydrogenase E1 component beta subunit